MNAYLMETMLEAADSCTDPVEEQGGIILSKNNEYCFVKVKNIHAGTSVAAGLYETDQQELREHVFSKMGEGWKFHASFHTHPQWSPVPSSLDLEKLFQGFKYNVIFAPKPATFCYAEWVEDRCVMQYIPKKTLQSLLKS